MTHWRDNTLVKFPTRSFNALSTVEKQAFMRWWLLHGPVDSVPKTAKLPDDDVPDDVDLAPVPDTPSLRVALKEITNFKKPSRRRSVPKKADEVLEVDPLAEDDAVAKKAAGKVSKKVSDCGATLQSASDRANSRSKKASIASSGSASSPVPKSSTPKLPARRMFSFIVNNR